MKESRKGYPHGSPKKIYSINKELSLDLSSFLFDFCLLGNRFVTLTL
jgi:hypothetical protein